MFSTKRESHGFGLDHPSRVSFYQSYTIDQAVRIKVDGVPCSPEGLCCVAMQQLWQ